MYASKDLVLTDRYLGDFTKKKEFVNLLKSSPSQLLEGKGYLFGTSEDYLYIYKLIYYKNRKMQRKFLRLLSI